MSRYVSRQWSWQNPLAAGALLIAGVVCAVAFALGDVWAEAPWLVIGTCALLVACAVIPLTVTITSSAVHVSLAGVLTRDIPAEDITGVDTRRYRPMREFGGWGWRFGLHDRSARAYTTTGASAVVLTLRDGHQVYLGVDDEQGCVDALAQVVA